MEFEFYHQWKKLEFLQDLMQTKYLLLEEDYA